jgi:hypothetical protein
MIAEQRYQASDDVIAREVGGEMVLLDLASGLYFGLDPVGTRIWDRLADGHCSLAEVCDTIEQEFDAPRTQIETDVHALVAQLLDKNLVSALAA